LLIPGGLVWAAGGLLLMTRVTPDPAYVSHYLPAVLLTGLGVSLCLPQLASASVQGLPPDQFGSGSAVNQAIRNLGGTLGVALVVALVSDIGPGTVFDAFRGVWWLLVASGVAVSALSLLLPRRTVTTPPALHPVAAPA
jgi:hypothetical protein